MILKTNPSSTSILAPFFAPHIVAPYKAQADSPSASAIFFFAKIKDGLADKIVLFYLQALKASLFI